MGQWNLSPIPSSIITRTLSAFQTTESLRNKDQGCADTGARPDGPGAAAGEFMMGARQDAQ